jgi:hypothetical protein
MADCGRVELGMEEVLPGVHDDRQALRGASRLSRDSPLGKKEKETLDYSSSIQLKHNYFTK